ncbi:MAG TPA: Hpt domain-containing protein [Methylophilaceae bacterium]|nr:Hpt domain-containing protein [Methylophilaceae bacterium]
MDFDIGPLSWVKDEIDQALTQALDKAGEFAASPFDSSPLRFCLTHVHQVSGALSMVGLDGVQRFSGEIETYISALEKHSIAASPENLDVLTRALRALLQYLQSLVDGAPDVPLRLFPEFKAMQEVLGTEIIQESELFFPDLFNSAPADLETYVPEGTELPAYLNEQGQKYRKLLVQWLRTPQDETLILSMRDALLAVERAQALPSQKTLWWVAVGLLEAIAQGALALDKSSRQLCFQLERQIHYLAQGNAKPNSRILRDALYYVAITAPVSERLCDIKRVFELEKYYEDEAAVSAKGASNLQVDGALSAVRAGLSDLKDCWMQVSAGDRSQFAIFHEKTQALVSAAEDGRAELKQALTDVHACAVNLAGSEQPLDAMFSIEMATTLLMLEGALGSSGKSLDNALQAAASQAAGMRAMLPGAEPLPESHAVPEASQDDTLAVLAQVADEIRANLQRVEQTLDDFFRDPETRAELMAVLPLFKQVSGAFRMLDQPVASAVIDGCQALVERFAQPSAQVAIEEFELVAESLSSLGFYLDRLLKGDVEASHAIDPLPERLQTAVAEMAVPSSQPAVETVSHEQASAPDIIVDRALDDELLEVYLAEAGEVHETIVNCMQTLRAQPEDQAALITVRRAFHTLKGSGRTVGLTAMGDVAWSVEQLLNHLLETRSGVTAPVLDFIDSVSAQFQEWVKQLFTDGSVALTPGVWKARADALLHPSVKEVVSDEPANTSFEPEVQVPAEKPADDVVVIGGKHAVNRQLFEIFLDEAKTNLALLQQMLDAAQVQAEPPIPDVARPAHTVGGVSRTVGLTAISDLGGALEAWLEKIALRYKALSSEELHLFDQALLALTAMLQKAENHRQPVAAKWLCNALRKAAETKAPAVELQPVEPPADEIVVADVALEFVAPTEPETISAEIKPTPKAPVAAIDSVPSFVSGSEAANVDQQLLEVFLEESNELMPLVGRQLREWRANPSVADAQQALQRALHTLKGSARMAGALRMGDDLHDLETQVLKALEKGAPTARSFTAFFKQYDSISDQLDELRQHAEAPAVAPVAEAESGQEVAEQTIETISVTPMMRVRSDAIDHLVNEAGEVSIARSRIERQIETFKGALLELTDSVIRLRSQLREAEIEAETQMQSRLTQLQEAHETFDPLEFDRYTRFQELTRMMAESVHDVATVQQGLMGNLNETEAALNEQSRMTKQLQQGLMRTRMVRFENVSERLHRIVRQTAAELKKPAELEIKGESVEIDRSVLEKMVGPLEHLLRNAIAHGLEDAKKRTSLKKPKTGRVQMQARQEGNEIILSLSDDGSGLDYEKIKAKAASLGMLGGAQESSPSELVSLIFEPGFSTSDNVTQVSGRGVGLDAVRADITALGGRIEVASESGQGCTFTIYLPLTLAVNQTVLVRVGSEEFLLPAPMVEQVQKIKHSALASIQEQGQFGWGGRQYPLYYLSHLLGRPVQPEPQAYTPVMLLRSGARRIALIVDEIRGNREIVVKNIGPQLAAMGSIAGATVMGDGKVMLVLNPIHMAFRETLAAEVVNEATETAESAQPPTIMVVDDSLTMRKVISRLLTREGYHPLAAKDGVDALQQLESVLPEVILLDIEMPRMDGFELSRAVRGNPRTAHIPLIVISSRTADKHRKYAEEIGVNVYLGKPYQEEELLAHITGFMSG